MAGRRVNASGYAAPTPERGGETPPTPLVSVIIPAYNHERFVSQALDSVRDEGYPNLEIIVIDDGSHDETVTVVAAWVAANPTVPAQFSRQENAGTATTANRLLARARGTFVVPLASDDRLLPGGIALRVAYLDAHPRLVAVFGDCTVINGNGVKVRDRGVGLDPHVRRRLLADPAFEIVNNWAIPGPVILYRREPVIRMGGYRDGLLVEDWDFYLRLVSGHRLAFIDHVVSEYRWHGENAGAREALALRLANELRQTAWRSRRLFRGRLRLLLVHEAASYAARSALLQERRFVWAGWRLASIGLKALAMIAPRL